MQRYIAAKNRKSSLPANKGLQRTALGADKIVAILRARIGSIAFPIYWCAAAEAQAVGHRKFVPIMVELKENQRSSFIWHSMVHDGHLIKPLGDLTERTFLMLGH